MPLKGPRLTSLACSLLLVLPPGLLADSPMGRVRVTGSVTNVRSEPSLKGTVLFQVKAGEELQVLEEVSGWYHVRDAGGREGYVQKDLAEAVGPLPPPPVPSPAPPAAPPSQVGTPAGQQGQGPAIDHKPVSCVVAGSFQSLEARFNPPSVTKPRVYFRADGTAYWYYVEMKPEGGAYSGILPKPNASLKKIDYYIEALTPAFATGRTDEYAPVVVERKSDCGSNVAAGLLPSGGKALVGSASAEAPPVPVGFEAGSLVASNSATAAASGGSHTLLYVAGGLAVAGGVALATKGGGSSSSSSSSSSGSSTPPVSITGTWKGPLASQVSDSSVDIVCNVSQTATLQLTQSGSTVTGSASGTVALGTCNKPFNGTGSGLGGPETLSGTASNGQVNLQASNGGSFVGTYTATTMTLQFSYTRVTTTDSVTDTFAQTGTANLTKQ